MSSPREEFTLTLLARRPGARGGRRIRRQQPLASAELYDPVANTWTPTGSLSAPKGYHSASRLPDGRVVVAGGLTLPGPVATRITEVYDPATGLWTRVGDMLSLRHRHVATLLPDGRVLAAGGASQSAAEIFDPGPGHVDGNQPLVGPAGRGKRHAAPERPRDRRGRRGRERLELHRALQPHGRHLGRGPAHELRALPTLVHDASRRTPARRGRLQRRRPRHRGAARHRRAGLDGRPRTWAPAAASPR